MAWLSQAWAEVVAGVRPGGPVDADHVSSGTGLDRLITPAKLQRYIEKPGTKGISPRRRSGGGFAPAVSVGHEISKFLQKTKPALDDDRIVKALSGQGAWWNILNRAAYYRSRTILARELPPVLAARVWSAMVDSWETYAKGQGFEFEHGPPAWIEGRHAFLALREARTSGQALLFDEPGPGAPVDLRTGELLELTAEDFGAAAAA